MRWLHTNRDQKRGPMSGIGRSELDTKVPLTDGYPYCIVIAIDF